MFCAIWFLRAALISNALTQQAYTLVLKKKVTISVFQQNLKKILRKCFCFLRLYAKMFGLSYHAVFKMVIYFALTSILFSTAVWLQPPGRPYIFMKLYQNILQQGFYSKTAALWSQRDLFQFHKEYIGHLTVWSMLSINTQCASTIIVHAMLAVGMSLKAQGLFLLQFLFFSVLLFGCVDAV